MSRVLVLRFLLLLLIPVLLLPSAGLAAEGYRVRLQPREGTNATGSGSGTLTLDQFETDLEFTITVTGLTGLELGAHIHRPNGEIAFALPTGDTKTGVWQGIGTIDLFLLQSEQLYILVHTEENPAGELRGDILLDTVPTTSASFGEIKQGYATKAQASPRPRP